MENSGIFKTMKRQWNILITGPWLDDMENSWIFKTMKRQWNILITGSWVTQIFCGQICVTESVVFLPVRFMWVQKGCRYTRIYQTWQNISRPRLKTQESILAIGRFVIISAYSHVKRLKEYFYFDSTKPLWVLRFSPVVTLV
jgi:hypothetical protein